MDKWGNRARLLPGTAGRGVGSRVETGWYLQEPSEMVVLSTQKGPAGRQQREKERRVRKSCTWSFRSAQMTHENKNIR